MSNAVRFDGPIAHHIVFDEQWAHLFRPLTDDEEDRYDEGADFPGLIKTDDERLLVPDGRWHQDGGIEQCGQTGGDTQISEGYSVRWLRAEPDGTFSVIEVASFVATREPAGDGDIHDETGATMDAPTTEEGMGAPILFLVDQTMECVCTDPSDVGGTESGVDYHYEEGADVHWAVSAGVTSMEDLDMIAYREAHRSAQFPPV